jgi:hypothetical protein
MKRTLVFTSALLIGGVAALGCSNSQPDSTNHTTAYKGTAYEWLATNVPPLNHKLNGDQTAVDAAAGALGTSGASSYERLGTACKQMLTDVSQAQQIPPAPKASLEQAWKVMLSETKAYASSCLTLVTDPVEADVSTWENALSLMNAANAEFNTQVAAVRQGTKSSSG